MVRLPTCSVVLTVNERPTEVLQQVLDSLHHQHDQIDQLVVVLDRTPHHLRDWLFRAVMTMPGLPVEWVLVEGQPGWLCPARAWNAGFAQVRSELVYCISSETVQAPGNVERAKTFLQRSHAVVFGKATESHPGKYGHSVPGGLLCSSQNPRPLGFIMAMPMWMVRAVHGYDEGFMGGYWYDDDDFTYRLWRLGQPFIFLDLIEGVHMSHPRPVLDTVEGQDGIARNRQYMLAKHGTLQPMDGVPTRRSMGNGMTIFFPTEGPGLFQQRVESWGVPLNPDGSIKLVH